MPGPEYYARRLFFEKGKDTKDIKREDITSTVIIEGVESTFEQVLSAFEQDLQRSQQYGKMVHSFVQYLLETDPEAKARAKDDAVGYAKKYGKEFTALEKHPDLKNIDLHFEDILERSGIVADPTGLKGISKSKLDRIAPEITLVSELLKDSFGNFIGTTADGIIQHANGEISLVDWKTGDIAKDMNTAYLMKYGSKFGISDSRLARGYLEVAFRAVILKEKHPDMRFRNIRIIKLNRDGSSQNMDVDLQPYLYTIGEYYKENHPEIYKEMVVKGMLEASQYEGISEKVVNVFDRIAHLPFEEQLLYLKTKLAALHGDKTKQQIERDPEIKKLSALYSEAILELEKLPGMNLKEQSPDLPSFGGLKNFSDVANPKLQVLHKILLDAKNTINQITSLRDNEHNKLYEAVQKESKLPKTSRLLSTSALAGVTYGLFTLQFLPFAGSIIIYKILSRNLSNTKDHFAFIWQKQNPGGKGDLYMNNEDWYLDGNSQVIKMTKAQMEYRNFIRDSMGKDFNAFASKVVEYTDGDETRPVYMFQKLGLPSADLPVGFMPRIPKPIEELREEENFLGSLKNPFGLKTTLGASAKNYFTSFIEDTYEDGNTPIPLRYFKHTGSKVVDSGAHSLNVEAAYKSFMASLHYKDNMDSVKNLFIGMSNAFDEKLDEKLNAKYPKTVE